MLRRLSTSQNKGGMFLFKLFISNGFLLHCVIKLVMIYNRTICDCKYWLYMV